MAKQLLPGTAVQIRHALPEAQIERGLVGVITAYQPEDRIFSIYFGPTKWVTFRDEPEIRFLERVTVLDK